MARIFKFLRRTPLRTFILYPIVTIAFELAWHGGSLELKPAFLLLMLWGYLQYRLCGVYRRKRDGGGPGIDTPPERLVMGGPYAYSRNPMYLGHIIYLTGLALTLRSLLAAAITIVTVFWFHFRVLRDEARLVELWGEPYKRYLSVTKRWIPGWF